MENTKYNKELEEYLHVHKLPSGLTCFCLPKKGFVEKEAMLTVRYGSVDNEFEQDGKRVKMPAGIAHYLEHKMFEGKDGSAFDKFAALGGSVNAFTTVNNTAYYFNCTEKFTDNLKLLLNFVQEPLFTKENVEKERGIISSEINMYKDDPHWVVYLNLLKGLYHNKYYSENIAGSNGSIKKITPELLYQCYEKFYAPSNMALVCTGDIEADEVFKIAEELVKEKKENVRESLPLKRKDSEARAADTYITEPPRVNKKFLKEKMELSEAYFYIGFKDNDHITATEDKSAAIKVLLDIIAGQSSPLYQKLYAKGYIGSDLNIEYMSNPHFAAGIFSGFSKDYERIAEMILKEARRLKEYGIDEERFERIKKKYIGRYIAAFNSIDSITAAQADCFCKGTDIFAAFESFTNLRKEDAEEYLNTLFKEEYMSVSVLLP